jgi:manganese oxidase
MVEITRLNAFAPETLVIPRGTTVVWKNHDFEVHSSVSNPDLSPTDPRVMRSPALQWDSGDITSGETFFHHFDAPGTYLYFCRYHPQMTGTIVVAHEEELEEEDEDEEENGAEGEEQETQP